MIIAKWLLGALFVAGLAFAYDNRDFVIDAYEVEEAKQIVIENRPVADISDYIDLSSIRTIDYESADYIVRDTRRVALPIPRPGAQTVVEPKVQGGTGSVAGRVTFEGEAVEGAEVQIERIIGNLSSSITVEADPTGAFEADELLGGRYRIRAYLPPSLSMRNAEVLFLPENGQAEGLELSLSNESSSKFSGRFVGDVARVGTNHTVLVEFRNAQVNAEGIIEDAPVANELVAITVRDPLTVNGSILTTSDATGVARFTVRCSEEGNGRITITSRNTDQNVTVPACTLPPRPTPVTVAVGESFAQADEVVAPRGTFQARPVTTQTTTTRSPNTTANNGQQSTTSTTVNRPSTTSAQTSTSAQGTSSTSGQSPTTNSTVAEDRTVETRTTRNYQVRSYRYQPEFSSVFAGSAICVLQYQVWQGSNWGPIYTHAGGDIVVFNRIARVLPSGGTPCEYVRVA